MLQHLNYQIVITPTSISLPKINYIYETYSEQRFSACLVYTVSHTHIVVVVFQYFGHHLRTQHPLAYEVVVEVVELVDGDDRLECRQGLHLRQFLPGIMKHLRDIFLRNLYQSLTVCVHIAERRMLEYFIQFLVCVLAFLQQYRVFRHCLVITVRYQRTHSNIPAIPAQRILTAIPVTLIRECLSSINTVRHRLLCHLTHFSIM